MSDIYKLYEDSLNNAFKNIDAMFAKSKNPQNLDKLKVEIKESNRLIKQMLLEINSLKTSGQKIPKQLEMNYKTYKDKVNNYNTKLLNIQESLLENSLENSTNNNSESKNYDKLLMQSHLANNKLNYIQRETNDVEKIGNNIKQELLIQTEQMKNMRDNINFMQGEAEMSNMLAAELVKKARKNKLIMYGCIVALITIFIFLILLKIY